MHLFFFCVNSRRSHDCEQIISKHVFLQCIDVYVISGNFSISLFASVVLIVGEEGKTKISNGGGDSLAEPRYFDSVTSIK